MPVSRTKFNDARSHLSECALSRVVNRAAQGAIFSLGLNHTPSSFLHSPADCVKRDLDPVLYGLSLLGVPRHGTNLVLVEGRVQEIPVSRLVEMMVWNRERIASPFKP